MKKTVIVGALFVALVAFLAGCQQIAPVPTYVAYGNIWLKLDEGKVVKFAQENHILDLGCTETPGRGEKDLISGVYRVHLIVWENPKTSSVYPPIFLGEFEHLEGFKTKARYSCPQGANLHLPLNWRPEQGLNWLEAFFPAYEWRAYGPDGGAPFQGNWKWNQ